MRFLRSLLIFAIIYATAYAGLRMTGHLHLYHGSLLAGSWVSKSSLMDSTNTQKFFQVSNLPAGLFAPLASLEASFAGPSEFNDTKGAADIRGKMSKSQIERQLPDKPEAWTVLGGWYEHHAKGDRESFHVVFRTSTLQVASDSDLNDLVHKLAHTTPASSDSVANKLTADQKIETHLFPAGATVYHVSGGQNGEWSEIVVDDAQSLACVSWGVEKERVQE